MHTTHGTSGIGALAIALLLGAWVLDAVLLLALAGTLLAFLLVRFIIFHASLRTVGDHLGFSREADRLIVRQGGAVQVTTTCSMLVPERVHVTVRDLVPAGAVVKTGATEGPCGGALTLRYEILMMATGAIGFSGVDVTVSDSYFRTIIRCRSRAYREPVIHSEPFNPFALTETGGLHGEAEQEKRHLLPGFGIRSFREFVMGDDPRHIDWKLSAKHARIFIREYTGISGNLPLVVLDLPDRDAASGTADSLKAAVAGLVEKSAVQAGGGHLLVIDGPNVVRSVPFTRYTHEVREVLTLLSPGERLVSLYRSLEPATVRSRSRRIAGLYAGDMREEAFFSGLSGVYGSFALAMKPSSFDRQVSRVVLTLPSSDMYLFSLFSGDQSHIRALVLAARKAGMQVHARTPAEFATPELLRVVAGSDIASIEVI